MIATIRQMLRCHWSARRIQRYLDADPVARLAPAELRRLEEHLARCERCTAVLEEHRLLNRLLGGWTELRAPDPRAVARLRATVDSLVADAL